MFKNGVKSKVLFFMVFSLILTLTFVLGNTDTSYAETGEELQLFTNEELQEIEDYMNENMNELNDENLGGKQTGIVELENGDEVEITVTNEIDTEGISPMTTVSPGQNRVFTVTKNRTGFLGGSMTTRAGYSALSGSNNIRMRGRYVTVDGIPPQFATIKNKHGYFTSNGPSNVLYVKSYLQFGAAGVSTRSTLDLTLKGGYKKVTTTYKWSQG